MNSKRMNRLEELGRVDSEKAYTKKGKENLGAEKSRIVRELKADGGKAGSKKRESSSTKGNIRHGKLKSQKELKTITDSKKYKDASYGDKTKMLNVATMATGGSVEDKIRKIGLEVKSNPLPKKTKNLLGKLKKAYSKRPGKKMGGSLKAVPADNKGLKKLPTEVRNKMGFMKKGGKVHGK